jgi:hypothetical protein
MMSLPYTAGLRTVSTLLNGGVVDEWPSIRILSARLLLAQALKNSDVIMVIRVSVVFILFSFVRLTGNYYIGLRLLSTDENCFRG